VKKNPTVSHVDELKRKAERQKLQACVLNHGQAEINLKEVGSVGPVKIFQDATNPLCQIQNYSPLLITQFYNLLSSLSERVFDRKNDHGNFVIFIERKKRIAFNSNGRLFFNLVYFETISKSSTMTKDEKIWFWFQTYCHELAHNSVDDHNADFANVMGYLTIFNGGKFIAFLQTYTEIREQAKITQQTPLNTPHNTPQNTPKITPQKQAKLEYEEEVQKLLEMFPKVDVSVCRMILFEVKGDIQNAIGILLDQFKTH